MAAALGSAAPVMGRPITSQFAPAWMASAGVMVRFWSSALLNSGRMPGVTNWTSSPSSARSISISRGEQTSPRNPAPVASLARRNTCSCTLPPMPSSARLLSSMLVSTVTPSTRGASARSMAACSWAAFSAAASISVPPEAWTVVICTPRSVAAMTALATVLGMSCSLRSRNTFAPVARSLRTMSGPPLTNNCLPTLNAPTTGASSPASFRAFCGLGRSSATMIGFFKAAV